MNNEIELVISNSIKVNGRQFTKVYGGFGKDNPIITDIQIAELLGYKKGVRQVRETFERNKEHFEKDIDYKDILKDVTENDTLKDVLKIIGYSGMSIGKAKNIYIFSESGFLKYITYADIDINEYTQFIYKYFNSEKKFISAPRKEVLFINKLEELLYVLNIDIGERQYIVKNNKNNIYRIDYYIPSLNIAIEYDENGHANYTYEQHEGRQKEIENKLGCKFIRVKDNKSFKENLKYIYNLLKEEAMNKLNNELKPEKEAI